MRLMRPLIVLAGLVAAWEVLVTLTGLPPYILPAPWRVALSLVHNWDLLLPNAGITLAEILIGLGLGLGLGVGSAILLATIAGARRWLMPIFVTSQAIPTFAIAPLLVLWLGYGIWSKVAVAALVIYFPVTSAFFDGLRRTETGWLDLAQVMNGSSWAIMREVRIPAALPALASGIRVAAAIAPIGAVIGEWVGSSAGLGFLMLHANGRMQIDLLFAALFVLASLAVALYVAVDRGLKAALPWQPDRDPAGR